MHATLTRIIAFVSGSVGVGTTFTTVHLGMALARMNKCVVEIDADVGEASLGSCMGVQDRFDADLFDVLDGRCSIRQALVRVERHVEIYILRLTQNPPMDAVKTIDLMRVCDQLRGECDFILIDSDAEVGYFDIMLALADEFVLVTVPDPAMLPAAKLIAARLNTKRKPCWLIVNRSNLELVKRRQLRSPYQLSDMLNIPLVGVIEEAEMEPANDSMVSIHNEQQPLDKSCDDTARRLLGEQVPFDKRYGSGGRLWRRLVSIK